ncbi:unnamed protein product [Phaedon cochleariae]|uniref:SH2 domain-containing protein n=1 Tax=Phaedon cochleariae TaxID=80249 RepID=A0A9P0GM16_PHACE|nr:unnamed protein product [Phaedon cochleariae]
MNKSKQMCWYSKVFFRVFANLAVRLCSESLDAAYKMCSLCWCSKCYVKETNNDFIIETSEEFYKEVSRESAEVLLENRQNGTFIIRPSKNSNLGTLSVIQDSKIFHLSIRKRLDGFIALGNEKLNEKCFRNVDYLINYYVSNYLLLYSNEGNIQINTLLIPFRDNKIIRD